MIETKECRLCHRIGVRGFLVAGGEEWECGNDRACKRRAERRALADTTPAPADALADAEAAWVRSGHGLDQKLRPGGLLGDEMRRRREEIPACPDDDTTLLAVLDGSAPPVTDEQRALPTTLPTPREVHTVCMAAGLVRDGDEWRDEHVSVEAVTTSCQPLAIDDDRPMYGVHVNDLRGFRSEQLSEQISGRLLWHTIRDVQTADLEDRHA